MDTGTVIVVLLVALVLGAVAVTILKGIFSGSAKMGGAQLRVKAGRQPPPPPGEARIEGSKAKRDASASGTRAIIKDTEAGRDLNAQAGEPPYPKA